ncbi:MAG: tRNA (adenosine(37)-N6)-threonylcarbamoyltransferase complex transferase subunit TsaD [Saprospiraceae bacterium]|jgi:N6-L-threonylcarbamoyladenine synthase|nr:tRNA (adenosine(37)-N6)-threonylcarbamoyltransferase complex transferase subunit TsaD [Saprospiraceae bacterium]HQW95641.1 tRNA (adenosine(37)-N6)-threonylcarbamoyltransferase complex transferase subunit TsaD [Saprospiraceae bacterium]
MSINILAIESSCDDTSAAIISDGKVLSNVVSSQDKHALWGGVVPEVASREHLRLIMPVVRKALDDAQISLREVNAVAITRAPGLLGSLHVGVSFAKSVSLAMDLPIIDVNHMDAHIMANFIDDPKPSFPFLCLTVSGGHTQISIVRDYLNVEIIGSTIDDAAGEAFDKTGKILGLDYPSGPIMDRMAQQGQAIFTFTEPNIPNLDFSFSGLKTAILYFLKKEMDKNPQFIQQNIHDLCASVQQRIVSILMNKLSKAVDQYDIREVALAGGVAANSALRKAMADKRDTDGWNIYIPKISYCTDNAAMIGQQAYFKYRSGLFADQHIQASAKV